MKASRLRTADQELPIRRPPPRKRNEHAAEEWALARAYHRMLVPIHDASCQLTSFDRDTGQRRFHPEWEYRGLPVDTSEIRGALFRGDKLDVRRVERVRYFVIDVDAHAAADAAEIPQNVVGLDANIQARMGSAVAKRRRIGVRDAAWAVCQDLLEREADLVPTQTRRGYQLVGLLDESQDAGQVRAAALALTDGLQLPDGVSVEVFPKPYSGAWSMCSLPLTGVARIVGPDGLKRVHRTRRQDVAWLLGHAPQASDFAIDSQDCRTWHGTRLGGEEETVSLGCGVVGGDGLADDGSGMPQTRGRAWREQLSDLLWNGMPDGTSFRAVPKIVAGCFYNAVPEAMGLRAFEAWVVEPIHGATHALTVEGRAELLWRFRAAWKRYERGVVAGWVKVGLMRAPEIRARYEQLATQGAQRAA